MNKKSRVVLFIFSGLLSLSLLEVFYLSESKSMSSEALEQKKNFVSITGLPDLALCSEAQYIRHRSLSNMFTIYSEDGTLREYSKASFAIRSLEKKSSDE